MKSLDDVIKALEMCTADNCVCFNGCPYSDLVKGDDCCDIHAIPEMQKDALQWLKGYRAHIELDKLRDKCEAENNPITWEELYVRNGLPVWIEDSFDNGEWYIIECFTASNRFIAHDRWGDTTLFNKKEMGDVWKAYRKEHHEN
jgi:hypothetical protein